ncbi:MAG: hypothetical protein SH819_06590 [Cytophagales bacterium]|nr:hypothetical protein [Cytophagales bacterium]
MNTKTILAGLAGSFFAFFGGWLIYGMLLMDYFQANTTVYEGLMKDPPDMLFLAVSNLAWGFLFAYLFQKIGTIKSFGAGFTNGLVLSFIITLMFDTSMYAFFNLNPLSFIVVDIGVGSVFGGVLGGVVGFVLGTGKQQ